MFKCKKCGLTRPGTTCFRVISKIRKVNYLLQVVLETRTFKTENGLRVPQLEKKSKTIKQVQGAEIVKEDTYCKNCIPETVEPEVVKTVKRIQIVPNRTKRRGNRYGKKKEK